MIRQYDTSRADIVGLVIQAPEFYKCYGQTKKIFQVEVKRNSGHPDVIQVMMDAKNYFHVGDKIHVTGELRSRRDRKGTILYIAADMVQLSADPLKNEVNITGTVANEIKARITPNGRVIADIMAAVNRKDNKSSYIPMIAWGHKAEKMEKLPCGSRISVTGRIQTRDYIKNNVIHTINEVSVLNFLS